MCSSGLPGCQVGKVRGERVFDLWESTNGGRGC